MASPPELTVITLSNRWRAKSQGFVGHAIAQHADVVSLDLHDIARLQIARRLEPRTSSGRRARNDDVTGHQRRERRDIVDQVAKTKDQPPSAVVLSGLTIHPRGQPDIRDLRLIGIRHKPGTE